jgi:hypothetical protein
MPGFGAQTMKLTLFILGLMQISLFGFQLKSCFIADANKHELNRDLLKSILDQELAMCSHNSVVEQAGHLLRRISHIADLLLKSGFASDAYAVPKIDANSGPVYNRFPLWEGERSRKEPIPLTFFAYVWPSEEYALQYSPQDPLSSFYGTLIHSHPIGCAFAVLEGTLVQKSYERVFSTCSIQNGVRLTKEEVFNKLNGDVDDLERPFIHRIYCRGVGSTPAVSLHVYAMPTAEKVMECFEQTKTWHTYNYVVFE